MGRVKHPPARFVTLTCRNTSRSLRLSKAALKCHPDERSSQPPPFPFTPLLFSRYFSLPTMTFPKESEYSSMTWFHTEADGHLELQIDSSSTMTLDNGGYATSDDIEMQTPRSEMQFFYEEKQASVAASPPSLPIAESSAVPKYSAKPWRKTWDNMLARKKWRRIIYGTVFITLLLGWVGVMSELFSFPLAATSCDL
jgi:hypothetical protein